MGLPPGFVFLPLPLEQVKAFESVAHRFERAHLVGRERTRLERWQPSSLTPLVGAPAGKRPSFCDTTQVVKAESDARGLLMVAWARSSASRWCCQATASRLRQVEMRSWP